MGRIQSSVGLVTGVPIEDTVNQLMELNGIPRDRLVSRTTQLQKEQVAVTELMTLVVGLQLTTDRLGQSSLYSATNVSSSKTDVLAARSTGNPATGSYSFIPVRQAQSQQLTSSLYSSSAQKVGAGEVVIHTGGFLDNSVHLDTLNGGAGVSRGSIRITDRSGVSQTVDLRFAQTANDVVDAINSTESLNVVASLDGDRFVLTDVSGSSLSNLSVSEVGGGRTAADLGLAGISTAATSATGNSVQRLSDATAINSLLDGRGLTLPSSGPALNIQLQDGSTVSFTTALDPTTASLGELLSELNAAGDGKLQARISSDGKSLELEDLTSGSGTLAVTSPSGNLAAQLGFDAAAVGNVISGDRLQAGLGDVLLSSLNGGAGFDGLGQLQIVDRSGATSLVDLSSATTLGDVVSAINSGSSSVRAQLNKTKTGIEIIDTTGATASNLIISNADASNTATRLKIEADVAASTVDSGSLNLQYINRNTSLNDFSRDGSFPLGQIRLTNSQGSSRTVNLSSLQPKRVGDVIDAINELGIGVEARINEAGDGLLIVDSAGGPGQLAISDVGSGRSAKELGIAGTSQSLTVGGSTVSGIDGSTTIRITTTADSTLADLAEQLNGLSNSPLNANLLNLNSSGGVRLLLNSAQSGAGGRVAIDSDISISFSETTAGRDALIAFGATETSGGVLVSSATNKFSGLITDVELEVKGTSATPVTVNISENGENISKQIEAFVKQYNTLRDKLSTVTAFDATTNQVGILFGSNAALRVDLGFSRLLSGTLRGAGSINSLNQVGIKLNESGKLEFDKAKFDAIRAEDPQAVSEFFTNETSGFSKKAKDVADSLASVESGALLNRSTSLQAQIDQNNNRIEAFNTRLDKQRERLLKQFYNMEQTIAKLQSNLTALNQLQVIPPLSS